MEESISVPTVVDGEHSEVPDAEGDGDLSADGMTGDTIVTADGKVLPVGDGVDRLRHSDEARLVELYEA
jgi:hypothetical protein